MAFRPFFTEATSASIPFAIRVSQAATSWLLGAPATPLTWQAAQARLYLSMLGSANAGAATIKLARATLAAIEEKTRARLLAERKS